MTNVVEINGQTFENITPEESTENEEDYDEDDEYDDEESNGVGFGFEYMPPEIQGNDCGKKSNTNGSMTKPRKSHVHPVKTHQSSQWRLISLQLALYR